MNYNEYIAELLMEAADILDEGAVKTNNSAKRRREKFLQRHNYDPKEKTIETKTGHKVHFNNDVRDSNEYDYGAGSLSISDKTLKHGRKYSDGTLYHEIGHGRFTGYADDVDIDKDKFSIHPTLDRIRKDTNNDIKKIKENLKYRNDGPYYKGFIEDAKETNATAKDKKSQQSRDNNYKVWKKHADYKSGLEHRQPIEFEADAVNVANNGLKKAKGSLTKAYKSNGFFKEKDFNRAKSSPEWCKDFCNKILNEKMGNLNKNENRYSFPEMYRESSKLLKMYGKIDNVPNKELIKITTRLMHECNRQQKETLEKRVKVMRDKNIDHTPYRKKAQNECIAELLIEAAELLSEE